MIDLVAEQTPLGGLERWLGKEIDGQEVSFVARFQYRELVSYVAEPVKAHELPLVAVDVRYEFDMVRLSTEGLMSLYGTRSHNTFLRNLFAESLNIHTRSLVSFFRGVLPVRGDDVVAQHYLPSWQPDRDGGESLVFLEHFFMMSINKRVAHLTAYRARVPKSDDSLPAFEIYWAVASLMTRFLDGLSSETREWFNRDGVPVDLSIRMPVDVVSRPPDQ